MSVTIQLRRDTAANWTSVNPILAQGEEGLETDTGKSKIGDGATAWVSLAYWTSGGVPKDALVIDVKDHGVKGDNTTDDTAAIQAVLALGGITFFPGGNYLYTNLTIPTGAVLKGVGSGGTGIIPAISQRSCLRRIGTATGSAVVFPTGSGPVVIEDIEFDGRSCDTDLLHFDDNLSSGEETQIKFNRLYVHDSQTLFYFGTGRRDPRISNTVFRNGIVDNVVINGSDAQFYSCDFDGAGRHNVVLSSSAGSARFQSCSSFGAGATQQGYGYYSNAAGNFSIVGGSVDRNQYHGVYLDTGTYSVTIDAVLFNSNGQQADGVWSHIHHAGQDASITLQGLMEAPLAIGYSNRAKYVIEVSGNQTWLNSACSFTPSSLSTGSYTNFPAGGLIQRGTGSTTTGSPSLGAWQAGDSVTALDGHVWICTVAGSPGTWVEAGHGSYAPTMPTVAWTSGNLVLASNNTVDATAGNKTPTLPTPLFIGQELTVEKTDPTTNTVAITGTIRGSSSTLTLYLPSESVTFRAESLSSWRIPNDHKTLGSLDVRYGSATSVMQAKQFKSTLDQSSLLASITPPAFGPVNNPGLEPVIVRPDRQFQRFMGVGAALTDASAYCFMNYLTPTQRLALLTELYGPSNANWTTLRIVIGASPFSSVPIFTYDDMPSAVRTVGTTNGSNVVTDTSAVASDKGAEFVAPGFTQPAVVAVVTPGTGYTITGSGGAAVNSTATTGSYSATLNQTDTALTNFSIAQDEKYLLALVQEIVAINPNVRIFTSVWSPPLWMNGAGTITIPVPGQNASATTFLTNWMTQYVNYIIAALQAFKNLGVNIYSLSPINEPFDPIGSNPYFNDTDYATLVAALGAALDTNGLDIRLAVHEHHWTYSAHVSTVLANSACAPYISDITWHAYSGKPTVGNLFARQYPGIQQHMTEFRCLTGVNWTSSLALMAGDAAIGSMRAGGSSVTLWNMLLDQNGNPNLGTVNGGGNPSGRRGVLTVLNDGSGTITRNPEYYVLRHLSQFVQEGAVRVASSNYATSQGVGGGHNDVESVAFQNPDGSIALLVVNFSGSTKTFMIIDARTGQGFPVTMGSLEMDTFTWGTNAYPKVAAATALTAPGAPTLAATGGKGETLLTITAGTAGNTPTVSFTINRSTTTGTEVPIATIPVAQTTYTDTVGAGTYYYTVVANNAAGAGTASTEHSVTVVAATAPGQPVVTLQPQPGGMIVNFTAPASNGSPITQYAINRSTTTGTEVAVGYANKGIQTFTDGGLSNGTTYYYTVTATNATGSTASAEVNGIPVAQLTFDNAGGTNTASTNANTLTASATIGGGIHRILIVKVGTTCSSGVAGVSGVTYGGAALTKLVSAPSANGGSNRDCEIWYLLSPTSGTANIVVSTSAVTTTDLEWISFSGAAQSGTWGTPSSTTPSSNTNPTVTTTGGAASDIVIGGFVNRGTTIQPTAGSGQTLQGGAQQAGGGPSTYDWGLLTTQAGGTGTITTSFTFAVNDNCSVVACALKAG